MVSFDHTFNLLPNSDKELTTFSISQISDHYNHLLCQVALNVKKKKQTNKKLTKQTKKKSQTKLEDYTYQNKIIRELFVIPYFRWTELVQVEQGKQAT